MSNSIRAILRHTIESPAGGLITTAAAWAILWPWLSHHRHTAASA